nr:GPP34 family phosphoprotein [Actinopolyspora biskrensis]
MPLPAELVLLLHQPGGKGVGYVNPWIVTIVAEIAELVLHGRVELRQRKRGKAEIVLLRRTPVGVDWLDRVLSLLARSVKSRTDSIPFLSWARLRREAFAEHRAQLCAIGGLEHRREKLLGFVLHERYFPHEAEREARFDELVRIARGEGRVDDRRALLVTIAHSSGLCRKLFQEWSSLERLRSIARGELLGETVSDAVADSSPVLGALASFAFGNGRGTAGGTGGGGGGDGGGGGE